MKHLPLSLTAGVQIPTDLDRPLESMQVSEGLARIKPGLYVDNTGRKYFYLTGVYDLVTDRLLERPSLNTPEFVSTVLNGVRAELEKDKCTEWMD